MLHFCCLLLIKNALNVCFFYLLKSINDWFSKIMRFHINTGVGEEFQLMGLGRTMQWSHHKIISLFPYCFHFCSNECKSHVCWEWVISKLLFHCFLVADMRLHLAVSVGPSVCPSYFWIPIQFLPYCSCPTVRDWIAEYPALFLSMILCF